MFEQFRPLLKIASALNRIATALEYFAINDARQNNRMYVPIKRKHLFKDESELMDMDSATIDRYEQERWDRIAQLGFKAIEDEEDRDV